MGALLSSTPALERTALVLTCEGMGDCLFAQSVIRKMHAKFQGKHSFALYTHHPSIFRACPYVAEIHAFSELPGPSQPPIRAVKMFELDPASDIWIILDLEKGVHVGEGDESTEEYSIRIAASLTGARCGGGPSGQTPCDEF